MQSVAVRIRPGVPTGVNMDDDFMSRLLWFYAAMFFFTVYGGVGVVAFVKKHYWLYMPLGIIVFFAVRFFRMKVVGDPS